MSHSNLLTCQKSMCGRSAFEVYSSAQLSYCSQRCMEIHSAEKKRCCTVIFPEDKLDPNMCVVIGCNKSRNFCHPGTRFCSGGCKGIYEHGRCISQGCHKPRNGNSKIHYNSFYCSQVCQMRDNNQL